ncbi:MULTISPECIES: NlpC/P60 family protein [Streptomyces]|uniref:NlpC/P60 family protein n=1 Tax=Streptomyces TaxID=1883 RepID=UPI001368B0BD|nr:C40 family peptidase [Streptomyces parvulus]MCQ4195235.1 NlpC/P60 family protein [Streptomyces parvulus]MZD54564.1 NlpC/P60 family protein [Streptomyces sp. SID5606]
MGTHRRPRQRATGAGRARTAATITLAGAATATGLGGTVHADPQPTAAQVRTKVDTLYRQAEVATEKYNGAKEKADAAEERLEELRDQAARKEDRLNSAREALGSVAAAQYRSGGLDPAVQLALSSDPDRYLDGAAFVERVGSRQTAAVGRVRKELRDIERLRGAARVEVASLTSRRAELKRHRETVTGKLEAARRLLSGLTAEERAGLGGAPASRASRAAATGPRDGLTAPAEAPNARAAAAVAYAYQKLGSPYVWGATGPDAFDCSGLTQAAYRAAGVSLPRTTYAQIDAGRRVSRSELAPGDLVFFYSGISHVGIYVGRGQMIHAPNPSAPVRLAPVDQMPFAGAARVV